MFPAVLCSECESPIILLWYLNVNCKRNICFLQFCAQNVKAQKSLLGGLEILLAKEYPELKSKTSHILKALYDLDVLEEAVILEWGKKVQAIICH